MSEQDTNILRRKIKAASTRQAKASLQNSLVKNIEKATAKVFLDNLNVEVTATVSERTIGSHTKTIDTMTSILFGIVDFDDEVGLTGCDARYIDTAIMHLAGGASYTGETRPVTKTDAAIFKLSINKILQLAFAQQDAEEFAIEMHGYEVEKAPLVFLLPEKDHALLRVHIIDNEKTDLGKFEIAIPLTCIEKISATEMRESTQIEHDIWREAMSEVAIDAPIELDTVVQRMRISLGRILEMKKGGLLDLTDGSLTSLSLEGQTSSGPKTIFKGHLGALKSQKAFKITRIPDDEYAMN